MIARSYFTFALVLHYYNVGLVAISLNQANRDLLMRVRLHSIWISFEISFFLSCPCTAYIRLGGPGDYFP